MRTAFEATLFAAFHDCQKRGSQSHWDLEYSCVPMYPWSFLQKHIEGSLWYRRLISLIYIYIWYYMIINNSVFLYTYIPIYISSTSRFPPKQEIAGSSFLGSMSSLMDPEWLIMSSCSPRYGAVPPVFGFLVYNPTSYRWWLIYC